MEPNLSIDRTFSKVGPLTIECGNQPQESTWTSSNVKDREKLSRSKDPEYGKIAALTTEVQQLIGEMNTGYRAPQEVRDLFSQLTGVPVDSSFWMPPPFYTNFGKNIRVGKDAFINHCCEFMDRGGITLEDKVFIGPKVNLITINHPVNPGQRRSTFCAPILIKRNAWIGVGASVCQA